MNTLYVVGTAGSGKTTLTGAFSEWLKDQEQIVATVNLDPAVLSLPYEPDVDVREIVDYERIMAMRGLGPNGGLVASVRELARNVEAIRQMVDEMKADWVIVDTPGQLELFAFRKEGRIIVSKLSDGRRSLLFLIDSMICGNPTCDPAPLGLPPSAPLSLGLSTLHVLTKSDAVPKRYIRRILSWHESEEAFDVDASSKLSGLQVTLAREVIQSVSHISSMVPLVPVSSKTMDGFVELHGLLTRVFGEGELELR
ncbi:MAG: ATP/GTP-binding protein [Nitrososphaerota archaeon]